MSTRAHRKCAKCGATAAQDNSVPFHRFPKPGTTNILRATAWAMFCWPDDDWSSLESLTALYTKTKVLCGRHFENSCYTDSSHKRLSKYAVPGTREYVIKTLHSLRSKIPSIVKKALPQLRQATPLENSADEATISKSNAEAGCSTAPLTPAAPPAPAAVDSVVQPSASISNAEAGCSTAPLTPAAPPAPAPVHSIVQTSACISNAEAGCSTAPLTPAAPPAPAPVDSVVQPSASIDTIGIKKTVRKRSGILKNIDKSKLSELSETEQRLYRICRSKINGIAKLRKKLKGKAKVDKIKRICDDEIVKKLFDLKLSHSFVMLLESQIVNCQRKQQGKRYNLDLKIIALTLYKKSPSCYRLLRRIMEMPCPSTLNKLLNKVPMKPGINQHVFNGLQAMAETLTEDEKLCTLLFDEMAIRKHLQYNPLTDSVDGFQDHGRHGRTDQVASNALVFMACGLRNKWKQPIAYYLTGKSATSDMLSVIIKEVLDECFRIGLNVVATVCDMCSVNIKALHALGVTTEAPYFVHGGKEIVAIADPPHLLKCLRNMFMAHNIEFPTEIQPNGKTIIGTAKWDHVRQFYELDKTNPHFVYAPALTERHIAPNTKQKMRVKLAAQVFSHTVTAGILAKVASSELPSEALATATLLQKFDQLFDGLNANSPDLRRGKKFSTNVTARSPHLKYFREMKALIKDMKFVKARSPPSQSGWVQTITAVERLWENLTKLGIQSLSTRRLNQDPLENFFGCVRYNCGSNYNPTIAQFASGFKTAIISNLRNNIKNKNCEDDDAVLTNNFKSFLSIATESAENEMVDCELGQFEDEDNNISDTPETENSEATSSELQACAYVCGFIVRKLNINCKKCVQLLTSKPGSEPAHLFTEFKEYEGNINKLKYSSENLIRAVEKAASVVKIYLEHNMHKENMEKSGILLLSSECKEEMKFLQGCEEHFDKNCEKILLHSFRISLKRVITLKNREFSEECSKRALQRKFQILQNK